MKLGKSATIMAMSMLICLSVLYEAMAQDSKLIVVASKATYQDAQKWVDFLTSREVPLQHVTPPDFGKYKNEKYIVVMVSMNESGGIGDIVKQLLTKKEQALVGQQGNSNMYIKSDLWSKDQTIIIFAGYNRDAANRVRINTKDRWWDHISSWFDIELDSVELYGY